MKRLIMKGILGLCLLISPAAEELFTVQFPKGVIQWNPHYAYTSTEAQVFTALYEGLVSYHPATLRPTEGAADSWTVSEDGFTWTFTLREDLKWSNGEKITSQDFKDSWIVLLSPKTKSEYASLLDAIVGAREYRLGEGLPGEIGVETPDSRTLVIQLKKRFPQFLSVLCHYSFAPLHRDFRERKDWSPYLSVPVNGPFRITARDTEEVLFVKNEQYWDAENVALEQLQFKFSEDIDQVMEQFNRYQIDWVTSGIDTKQLNLPDTLVVAPLFSTTYFYFSNRRTPWENGLVRQALAKLLPWSSLRKGRLIPGATLVPPIPDYPEGETALKGEPDPQGAMLLLEEAGYPQGRGLPDLVIRIPQEDPVVQLMKEAWEEALPLNVSIETIPYPHYYESLKQGDYDLGTLSWTGDYADPLTFLGMWESGSSFNDALFSDEIYDQLLEESADLPYKERMAKLREAEERLIGSAQVLPMEHFPSINLIDRRFIKGWYSNALDIHPFKSISRSKGFKIPGMVKKAPANTPAG